MSDLCCSNVKCLWQKFAQTKFLRKIVITLDFKFSFSIVHNKIHISKSLNACFSFKKLRLMLYFPFCPESKLKEWTSLRFSLRSNLLWRRAWCFLNVFGQNLGSIWLSRLININLLTDLSSERIFLWERITCLYEVCIHVAMLFVFLFIWDTVSRG